MELTVSTGLTCSVTGSALSSESELSEMLLSGADSEDSSEPELILLLSSLLHPTHDRAVTAAMNREIRHFFIILISFLQSALKRSDTL